MAWRDVIQRLSEIATTGRHIQNVLLSRTRCALKQGSKLRITGARTSLHRRVIHRPSRSEDLGVFLCRYSCF